MAALVPQLPAMPNPTPTTSFDLPAPERPPALRHPDGEHSGSGRPQTYARETLIEALTQYATITDAARSLGCTPELFHQTARTDAPVQAALRDQRARYDQQVGEALTKTRGNISQAATLLGTDSKASLRYYINRSPRLRATLKECREGLLDTAEANVFEDIEKGSIRSSWKLLQTLGKDRGYTEKREMSHSGTVHHAHDVRHHTTRSLVAALDDLAELSPEAVEAEFVSLPAEDRALLTAALDRHQQDSAEARDESD